MKYYAAIFRVGRNQEKAFIVKANDYHDAVKLVKDWRGILLNVVEVVVSQDYIGSMAKKDDYWVNMS